MYDPGKVMTVAIREVAMDARVSTATVSHVLNNTGPVKRETYRRVLAAAKKLGYVPNTHARNLAGTGGSGYRFPEGQALPHSQRPSRESHPQSQNLI